MEIQPIIVEDNDTAMPLSELQCKENRIAYVAIVFLIPYLSETQQEDWMICRSLLPLLSPSWLKLTILMVLLFNNSETLLNGSSFVRIHGKSNRPFH